MTNTPQLPEGVTPLSAEEVAAFQAWARENDALIAAQEAVAAAREAALAAPITPLPVDGTTVDEVKASAEAAIADLAQQMQDRINLIAGS